MTGIRVQHRSESAFTFDRMGVLDGPEYANDPSARFCDGLARME
jgi:hypothetical protein